MDGGVVMTAHTEGTLSKHLAVSEVGNSTLLVEDVEQHAILGLARNDNHIVEVFGSCADERDATYINLLDNVGLRSVAGNGLLKRIEVNDNEVYFGNFIFIYPLKNYVTDFYLYIRAVGALDGIFTFF